MMKRYSFLVAFALTAMIAGLGCGGGGRPVKVEGVVTLDGQPLEGAVVRFVPAEGGGKEASGATGSDGSFRLTTFNSGDGALPGAYKVVVTQTQTVTAEAPAAVQSDEERMKATMEAMKQQGQQLKKATKARPKTKIPATYSGRDRKSTQ